MVTVNIIFAKVLIFENNAYTITITRNQLQFVIAIEIIWYYITRILIYFGYKYNIKRSCIKCV